MKRTSLIFASLAFILSIIALIWPAIYNGFPLVYSDSGSYIYSGFYNQIPIDRPIFYGWFVRHLSLATSLWFVIIAQAIIVWYTLYCLVKLVKSDNAWLLNFLIISLLSFTTGLSNYTSQIMPDIFSGIMIISVALLFTSKKLTSFDIILFIVISLCGVVHLSNLILLTGMTLVALFTLGIKRFSYKYIIRLVIVCVFPILTVLLVNKTFLNSFQLSRAPSVFIYGRMIETGVMQNFLSRNCNNNSYIFCDQIETLPNSAIGFIWEDDSPLFDSICRDIDWTYCWEEKNEALGKSINGVLKSGEHRNTLARIYASDFLKQITLFTVGIMTPQTEKSTTYKLIKDKLVYDLKGYLQASQFKKTQEFKVISILQLIMVILSALVFICYFFNRNPLLQLRQILLLSLIGIIGNALTVTIFSTVIDRYQARIIWIIPLIALIIIYKKGVALNRLDRL
jgi:hypothetical protein